MLQTLILPIIGALLLLYWTGSTVWALRPAKAAVGGPGGPTDGTTGGPTNGPHPSDEAGGNGQPGTASAAVPESPAAHRASLARARAARGRTRNGLLGAAVTVVVAFVAVRLLFVLPGWFQLAWVLGLVAAAYSIWRIVVLWPTAEQEKRLDDLITRHGMKSVGLPWTMIITLIVLLALWIVPPLLLF